MTARMLNDQATEKLIREYYACFNERRFADAAKMFVDEATVERPPFTQTRRGSNAYKQFADTWLRAFPDALFIIQHVEQRNETICEVDLTATGTHTNALDVAGIGVFKPSATKTSLKMRELLEIQEGKIAHSSVSFDLHALIHQLANIDYAALDACLQTVQEMRGQLDSVRGDRELQRRLTERLGFELDAARLIVRPWFRR
jgi:predicted ester cyclase